MFHYGYWRRRASVEAATLLDPQESGDGRRRDEAGGSWVSDFPSLRIEIITALRFLSVP